MNAVEPEVREQAPSSPPAPPRAAAAIPDYTVELEQLAKLRDDGVISPDEFEAKKKPILDS